MHANQEPQTSADKNSDSEEESEYEDAEDGILPFNDSTVAQTNFECRVCGESTAAKFCKDCKDTFCRNCDEFYHKHPSRQHHVRTEQVTSTAKPFRSAEQPVASATTATRTSETRKQCGPVASPVVTVASTNTESRYYFCTHMNQWDQQVTNTTKQQLQQQNQQLTQLIPFLAVMRTEFQKAHFDKTGMKA